MKWFDRWFAKHSQRAWESTTNVGVSSGKAIRSVDRDIESMSSVTFRFHTAHNGTVTQVSWYDSTTEQHHSELYIITADQDFGEEVASIAMQHRLRHR